MKKHKTEIITFKVDEAVSEALKEIPNKSEFIRSAVTSALAATCPLCQGAGYLTPSQKEHWDNFSKKHTVSECRDCHEKHIICSEADNSELANI
ncbi:MAG: CopG family transcriptional regulator [candidate division Zixibacteria bacterium]|nr:CopG family transcriptional regulator [candidate division Zixibacteria bacterium]